MAKTKRGLSKSRYRDTKTGKFVSESTWKRSKAHGGTRYRRVRVKPRKTKPRRKLDKIDPEKAIKKVLDELNLPLGGPFDGEHGLYRTRGEYSGPPEYLVSIVIDGENDQKIIKKRIRPVENTDIIEFEPGWETIGTTF